MNPLRLLASQTAVYGLSSIAGRFLTYLLVPLYTYTFSAGEYGVVSEFYAYAGFLAVALVFGLETGYFRFHQREDYDHGLVYGSALGFLILGNLAFVAAVATWRESMAQWLHYADHPEYLLWFAALLAMDAISALPLARLRVENRAWRFAGIRLAEILLTVGLNLFFLTFCRHLPGWWHDLSASSCFDPTVGVGYIFLSNLAASTFKLLLLVPQLRGARLRLAPGVLRPLLAYSLPMVAIGLAGMVNEMLDRAILKYWLPYDADTNLRLLGIYGACYKLSILMSLFVQAFRYAGEPFFFAYAGRADARRAYALVMDYFVIFCVFIFLLVALNLHIFQYFIGAEFRAGLGVVPVLLLANLFLGVYVNLSIWYKLTDRTGLGAWISIAGAAITVALNLWWIPLYGYEGSAWATLVCYACMAAISYGLGRLFYPVPYRLGKCGGYLALGLGLYASHRYLLTECRWNPWTSAGTCLAVYLLVAAWLDIRPLFRKAAVR